MSVLSVLLSAVFLQLTFAKNTAVADIVTPSPAKIPALIWVLDQQRLSIGIDGETPNIGAANKRPGFGAIGLDETINPAEKAKLLRTWLLDRLDGASTDMQMRPVKKNLFSLSLTEEEFLKIQKFQEVNLIRNKWHRPMLTQSVPLVYPNAGSTGINGDEWAVALIDSGINKSHDFIAGKSLEIAEACFSNDNNSGALAGGVSLCPDSDDPDSIPDGIFVGPGAGNNCAPSIAGCDHGTKSAGIIVGESVIKRGVAPDSQIISIQVYSKSNDETVCGGAAFTPCIGALTSDIIRALDYIYSIRNQYRIASINLGLGSTQLFQGFCDAQPEKESIDQLRGAGIPVVTPSGNSGSLISMSSPACISSAISVAATFDTTDSIWPDSNQSGALDVFAPGSSINTSTLPSSLFSEESGTSFSTAHVSAAWALFRQAGGSGVNEIENLIKTSGPDILLANSTTRKRLAISEVLSKITPPVVEPLCFPLVPKNKPIAVVCL